MLSVNCGGLQPALIQQASARNAPDLIVRIRLMERNTVIAAQVDPGSRISE
jgi:hypothetical protein